MEVAVVILVVVAVIWIVSAASGKSTSSHSTGLPPKVIDQEPVKDRRTAEELTEEMKQRMELTPRLKFRSFDAYRDYLYGRLDELKSVMKENNILKTLEAYNFHYCEALIFATNSLFEIIEAFQLRHYTELPEKNNWAIFSILHVRTLIDTCSVYLEPPPGFRKTENKESDDRLIQDAEGMMSRRIEKEGFKSVFQESVVEYHGSVVEYHKVAGKAFQMAMTDEAEDFRDSVFLLHNLTHEFYRKLTVMEELFSFPSAEE